jgi:hypothetical protein
MTNKLYTGAESTANVQTSMLGHVDLCQPSVSASELKCRAQMLNFIDPLVLMFNEADFDALAKALARTCDRGVISHVGLAFGPATQSSGSANTAGCSGSQVHTAGISSVLLLWMLLHETHPDGVMQVLDKRACYRVAPASTGLFLLSEASNVEVVLKLTGTCLTSRPLQEVFRDLVRGPLPQLTWEPPGADGKDPSGGESRCPQTDALAIYIATCLAMEGGLAAVTTGKDASHSGSVLPGKRNPRKQRGSGANSMARRRAEVRPSYESSRGYLLEMRVIFDERAVIADWTTAVLAAEIF